MYTKLYKEFKKVFIRKEWTSIGARPGEKYGVWGKLNAKRQLVVDEKFKVSQKFFYERNQWAEDGEDITLKAQVLNDVLVYIDCSGENTQALLDDFYKKYKVEDSIILAQKKLDETFEEEEQEKNYAIKTENLHITGENINQRTINYNYFGTTNTQQPIDDITAVVYRFYEHIAIRSEEGYRTAWSLLSEDFHNRIWIALSGEGSQAEREKAGFELFKKGYFFFRALSDLHVFNLKVSGPTAHCMVYYKDELELPHISELNDLGKTAIKDVGSVVEKIRTLATTVERLGGKGFGDKAIIRLFYPTAVETVWFEHGVDPVGLKAAFPLSSTAPIDRLFKCRCVRQGDQWRIDGLLPLHCRQLH
ncbi:hypothetical protein ACO2Q8_09245 [Larkinella sp. VNQ87]|uniref:hypothetical protein n=1 Tax=Larkinella sp. VNQ87 TaxID=3400921 RepID=UPI003C03C2B6